MGMTDNYMKPCPFCGGSAVFEPRMDCAIIRCINRNNGCPVNMRTHKSIKTFRDAQSAWNMRAQSLPSPQPHEVSV